MNMIKRFLQIKEEQLQLEIRQTILQENIDKTLTKLLMGVKKNRKHK